MKNMIKTPKSKFLKVQCLKCSSEQVVFGNAASRVTCNKCGEILVEPTGGKSRVRTKVLEVLE